MGTDNSFGPIDIAISGMRAQNKQMELISSNVTNARTTDAGKGEPYRRLEAVFKSEGDLGGVKLDEMLPDKTIQSRRDLITFVKDRPGHDFRYAIDCTKLETELGWQSEETFETGLRKTIQWYLDNKNWIARVNSGEYLSWVKQHYGEE